MPVTIKGNGCGTVAHLGLHILERLSLFDQLGEPKALDPWSPLVAYVGNRADVIGTSSSHEFVAKASIADEGSRSAWCQRTTDVRPKSNTRRWSALPVAQARALDRRQPRRQPDRKVIATSFIKVLRRPLEPAQYVSIKYTERLAEAGLVPSVGSVGDSYDNALAETINGLYKAEVIHRRGPWRSLEAVEYATLEWVDWFNNRRLLEPIGNVPPAEAEAAYYTALEEPAALAA